MINSRPSSTYPEIKEDKEKEKPMPGEEVRGDGGTGGREDRQEQNDGRRARQRPRGTSPRFARFSSPSDTLNH